jgi:hypothetical protein
MDEAGAIELIRAIAVELMFAIGGGRVRAYGILATGSILSTSKPAEKEGTEKRNGYQPTDC